MTDIGKIMITPKNAFVGGSSYEILDSVTYQGKAYLSKVDNNTHTPTGATDTYWFMYAENGETPEITVSDKVAGIVTVTITLEGVTHTIQIADGGSVTIASISKVGRVTTVVLQDNVGTQSFTIEDGIDGKGIVNVTKETLGLVDTYTITYSDDTQTQIVVTNGKGIVSIEKTSSVDLVDTYTITFNDSTTQNYTVTNGKDGKDGEDGEDGKGIVSIVKTSSSTDVTGRVVDTYTITYTDETTQTYTIVNGKDGTGTGDMEKAVYDKDNDGKVDAAETADSVEWKNVDDKPFAAIGDTLEVVNVIVSDEQVPTLNAKAMTGANSQSDGAAGMVPKPEQGDQDKFLGGNGRWRSISQMTGASASADGQAGMVPTPLTGDNVKVLYGDGTWKELATMTGASASNAGAKGLVPAPSAGDENKVLKGDGTWGDNYGIKVTSTISGNTVSFTNSAITSDSLISNPYIQDVFVGIEDVAISGTTVTFTLSDDSADGKSAIIYIK